MATVTDTPPTAPPVQYSAPLGTRWEKEKAAAGDGAFEYPDDAKSVGPWIVGECVGKGASGRVKIARHSRTGQLAAVKILPLQPLLNSRASLKTKQAKSDKQRLGIDREIVMMKLMNHPNILRIYDVYEGEKELYLILEYVEGGELFDFLVNRGRLPQPEALSCFKQIAYGLNYAHTFAIIHRDLKPENILIHSLNPLLIKIADWGMAAFAPPARQLETSCGSPHYASPEIVNGEKYEGTATDIWSCGVILYALLTGRLPFDDKNVRVLLGKVKAGKFDMPQFIDPLAKDLLSRMLVVDVEKRITMSEILAHPWLETETPGIVCVPAPPICELDKPLRSPNHINRQLLECLRVIWGRHPDVERITADLISPAGQGTLAKAFYFLLQKHRDRILEEHGIFMDIQEDERNGSKQIIKQYAAPPVKPAVHEALETAARSYVQPTRAAPEPPSTTLSALVPSPPSRFRSPSPVGPRAPKSRPASSPAQTRPAARSQELVEPGFSTVKDHTSVLAVANAGNHPPVARDLLMLSPARPSPTRRATQSVLPDDAPPRLSVDLSPVFSPREAPRQVSATPVLDTPEPRNSKNFPVIHAPVPRYNPMPMIDVPKVADPELQRTMEDIAGRVNNLVARENAAVQQARSALDHAEAREPGKAYNYIHANAGVVHLPDGRSPDTNGVRRKNKENRAHSLPPADDSPTCAAGGLGFDKIHADKEVGTISDGRDFTKNKEQPRSKGMEQRTRPKTLDFSRSPIGARRSTLAGVQSPHLNPTSSPAMALLGSPVVDEFKGWFSNLFNWKAQTYILYSVDDCMSTRDESIKILGRLKVSVVLERECVDSVGFLKCLFDERGSVEGPSTSSSSLQKEVRFRVEFAHVNGGNISSTSTNPRPTQMPLSPRLKGITKSSRISSDFVSSLTIIQEKGSLSTFKSVYMRFREEWTRWRADALKSPDMSDGFEHVPFPSLTL